MSIPDCSCIRLTGHLFIDWIDITKKRKKQPEVETQKKNFSFLRNWNQNLGFYDFTLKTQNRPPFPNPFIIYMKKLSITEKMEMKCCVFHLKSIEKMSK